MAHHTSPVLPYAIFEHDLRVGVVAIARSIGTRQSTDLQVLTQPPQQTRSPQHESEQIAIDAKSILELCQLVQDTIAINMQPIAEIIKPLVHTTTTHAATNPHEQLVALSERSLGKSDVGDYTKTEKLAIRRLFAAIHLALWGPLPVENQGACDGNAIVGCPECIINANTNRTHLTTELAVASRDGELDPDYTPPAIREQPQAHLRKDHGDQRFVRLTWKYTAPETAAMIQNELSALGFTVAVDMQRTLVVAQKPLNSDLTKAMKWGSQRYAHLGEQGVTWYGAQRIFNAKRNLLL